MSTDGHWVHLFLCRKLSAWFPVEFIWALLAGASDFSCVCCGRAQCGWFSTQFSADFWDLDLCPLSSVINPYICLCVFFLYYSGWATVQPHLLHIFSPQLTSYPNCLESMNSEVPRVCRALQLLAGCERIAIRYQILYCLDGRQYIPWAQILPVFGRLMEECLLWQCLSFLLPWITLVETTSLSCNSHSQLCQCLVLSF